MNNTSKFKCPCCGKYTLTSQRMFNICPNCGWEDDNIQYDNPDYFGGANFFSLNKYRSVFQQEKNVDKVKEIQDKESDKYRESVKKEYSLKMRCILKKRIYYGSPLYWTDENKKELIDLVSENFYEFNNFRTYTASIEENKILDETQIDFDNLHIAWKQKSYREKKL